MSKASKLFNAEQKQQIIAAIQSAENNSSAELRLHVEDHCKADVLDRAVEVFNKLGMEKTELRNGILIYLAVVDHKCAIIGDESVNKCVHREFWNECHADMISLFREERYTEGVCKALSMLEEELANHFPHQDNDVNELPDEISIG